MIILRKKTSSRKCGPEFCRRPRRRPTLSIYIYIYTLEVSPETGEDQLWNDIYIIYTGDLAGDQKVLPDDIAGGPL